MTATTIHDFQQFEDIASGSRFSLSFVACDVDGPADPRVEKLGMLAQAYGLSDEGLVARFVETDSFLVHDVLLAHRGGWLIGLEVYDRTNEQSRTTFRHRFRAAELTRVSGDCETAQPLLLTVQFPRREARRSVPAMTVSTQAGDLTYRA